MVINLSEETIKTAYNALRSSRNILKNQLDYSLPAKKVNPSRKPIIEHQLAEVEDALAVFEELMDSI